MTHTRYSWENVEMGEKRDREVNRLVFLALTWTTFTRNINGVRFHSGIFVNNYSNNKSIWKQSGCRRELLLSYCTVHFLPPLSIFLVSHLSQPTALLLF